MKLAITADLHLSSYRSSRVNPLEQVRLGLIELADYVNKNNLDGVVVAGDIFHDKTLVYKNALDTLYEFADMCNGKPIWLIHGNHDVGKHGSLLEVVEHPNIHCITEPYRMENMLLVPWTKGNLLEVIVDNFDDNVDILISHFGLYEAKLQSGISFIDPIKLKDVKAFKLVILGHYHLAQELDNVVYTGNLAPLDWNDKNQEKRFIVLDTETLEWDSIPVKTPRRFLEFVEPSDEELKAIQNLIDEGHFVRVISKKKIDLEGVVAVYNVEYESKFSGLKTIREIAKKFVENHPEKNELMQAFDDIEQHVRSSHS